MRLLHNSWFRKVLRRFVNQLAFNHSLSIIVRTVLHIGNRKEQPRLSWEDLDVVLERERSLSDFLANSELVEKYYQTLAGYLGRDRFPRRSYDAIMKQLLHLSKTVPGFDERAWLKPRAGVLDFEISTAGQSTGRDLNLSLWKHYRFRWLSQLQIRSSAIGNESNTRQSLAEIDEYLSQFKRKTHLFDLELRIAKQMHAPKSSSLGGVSKKEAALLRSQFYRTCRNDQKLQKIAAWFLYRHLTSDKNLHFFQFADADLIVHFLRELKQNPRQIFAAFPKMAIPGPLLSNIKSLIPNPTELLEDQRMFPVRKLKDNQNRDVAGRTTRHGLYRTRTIRPFHAIWLGIPANDCLAGDPTTLESLTPKRWGVSLLKDTLTCILERNGSYQGFVRCVPLTDSQQNIHASIEFWAPTMVSRVLLKSEALSVKSSLFFDAWLPKFSSKLPSSWKSLVISNSVLIDNSGIKRNLHTSKHWSDATEVESAAHLQHIDLLFDRVRQSTLNKEHVAELAGDMVFDAKISDATQLRRLSVLR